MANYNETGLRRKGRAFLNNKENVAAAARNKITKRRAKNKVARAFRQRNRK